MLFRGITKLLGGLGTAAILWLALPMTASGQNFGTPSCAPCREHCPPFLHVFVQGPPRMCWRRACPKPICDPCQLPHWGFYETCWHPWPFPPDWSHCHSAPPAAYVTLDPMVHPNLPQVRPGLQPQPVPNFPTPTPTPRSPTNPGGGANLLPSDGDLQLELPAPRPVDGKRR